jgi:regulatory protein
VARITGLEPDPRHPDAVRVLVDGKLFCTVHQAAVRAGALAVGAEWSAERAGITGQAADEEAAWRALLKALERRSHATAELRRRLLQKGHPPAAVDSAIGRAREAGLLDDVAFARNFVESRAARGRGPARLRRDLAAMGVAREHVDTALRAQWADPEDALTLAAELAAKRARQLAGLPREVRRRRLVAYLARRGFSGSGVVELVVRVLRVEAPAED